MNKNGFTLVELILVVVIIGIISVITIPSIMDALSESKTTGGETVEKILETNLELYNTDNKEDLWCLEDSNCTGPELTKSCISVSINTLYSMNPDIDFGDCVLKDASSLMIKRTPNTEKFTYYANIMCSKDFKNDSSHIFNSAKYSNGYNLYYETNDQEGVCPSSN